MTQGCAVMRLPHQGFLMTNHAAKNNTRLKYQITKSWLGNDVVFTPELWQLLPRTTKTRKSGTKGASVEHTAMWLDCDASVVTDFRDTYHLLITKLITSEYPLLWNLTFIPVSKVGDLGNNEIFRATQAQSNFIHDSLTFPVERWNPLIDPYQDAPFIEYGTSP